MNGYRIISISDLHWNHHKIPTIKMVEDLKVWLRKAHRTPFKNNTGEIGITYLVLAGDIFDRPTHFDTDNGRACSAGINFILDYCHYHNLVLVIDRGTRTHDGDMPAHFVSINNSRLNKVTLFYADKISIFNHNGRNILCIPDEVSASATLTESMVKSALKEKGLEQVDFTVTHAMYKHHLIEGINDVHNFDGDYFSSITKDIVLNGHNHKTSLYKKVLTNGDLYRICHGDEGAKGGYVIDVTDKVDINFVENENSNVFNTYTIKSTGVKSALKEIRHYIISLKLEEKAFIRIAHNNDFDINELVKELDFEYKPDIEFTVKDLSVKKKEVIGDSIKGFDEIKVLPITKNTINDLMINQLTSTGLDNERVDSLMILFKQVIN